MKYTLAAALAIFLGSQSFAETRTAINIVAVSKTTVVTSSAVVSSFVHSNNITTPIRVVCESDTYFNISSLADTTPTGYVSDSITLIGNIPEYFEILRHRKVAFRGKTIGGTCEIGKGN